jgi:hypothetical protein
MDRDRSVLLQYKTLRKCGKCKSYVTLEDDGDKVVYYKKAFWHITCLREWLLSKKIGKMCGEEVDKLIEGLKEETEDHIWHVVVRNHLYKYWMDKYNVVSLPHYIYTKVESIANGSFKNISKPVKLEHLLDMFQRQQNWLDKMYHKEKLEGVSKLNYDIAVIVARYGSYVDWLEKTKVEREQAEVFIQIPKINLGYLANARVPVSVSILDDDEDE